MCLWASRGVVEAEFQQPTIIGSLEYSFIYNSKSWPGSSVGRAED